MIDQTPEPRDENQRDDAPHQASQTGDTGASPLSSSSFSGRSVNANELRYILCEPKEHQQLWQLLGNPKNNIHDPVILSMPTDGQGVRVRVHVSSNNEHEFPESVKFPFKGSVLEIPVEVERSPGSITGFQ